MRDEICIVSLRREKEKEEEWDRKKAADYCISLRETNDEIP